MWQGLCVESVMDSIYHGLCNGTVSVRPSVCPSHLSHEHRCDTIPRICCCGILLRRRCCWTSAVVDRHTLHRGAQQQTRRTPLLRSIDRTDIQTEGHQTVTYTLLRIQRGQCQQGIAPGEARRYAPADGSSTRSGSTSVRERVRSPHISGGG